MKLQSWYLIHIHECNSSMDLSSLRYLIHIDENDSSFILQSSWYIIQMDECDSSIDCCVESLLCRISGELKCARQHIMTMRFWVFKEESPRLTRGSKTSSLMQQHGAHLDQALPTFIDAKHMFSPSWIGESIVLVRATPCDWMSEQQRRKQTSGAEQCWHIATVSWGQNAKESSCTNPVCWIKQSEYSALGQHVEDRHRDSRQPPQGNRRLMLKARDTAIWGSQPESASPMPPNHKNKSKTASSAQDH